ncbi:hypothetical protein FQR65_LT17296 [Abscondita terminalis]|nr:hypothetical protein FQR65_LT17296 [Abscondita terminalis]
MISLYVQESRFVLLAVRPILEECLTSLIKVCDSVEFGGFDKIEKAKICRAVLVDMRTENLLPKTSKDFVGVSLLIHDYVKAREKAKIAEETSGLCSDVGNHETKKRKRVPKTLSSGEASFEESELPEPPSLKRSYNKANNSLSQKRNDVDSGDISNAIGESLHISIMDISSTTTFGRNAQHGHNVQFALWTQRPTWTLCPIRFMDTTPNLDTTPNSLYEHNAQLGHIAQFALCPLS